MSDHPLAGGPLRPDQVRCPDVIPPWMTLAADNTFRLCGMCGERIQDCDCADDS